MRGRCYAVLVLIVLLLSLPSAVRGQGDLPETDLALARRYAPVFYFHSNEVFRPQPVDVLLKQARLRRSRKFWFDAQVLLRPSPLDLMHVASDQNHFLDVWYGDEGSSAYTNYSAHRAFYEAALSPQAGGPPITVYAHVVRDSVHRVTLQYWAFYFYNDWFNKHEGDWEMVQVMLGADGEPRWVVLSQHHGGTRRAWAQTPVEDATHPAVYVALGSHANYFVGDEVYPNTKTIGERAITVLDRTGTVGRIVPEVVLLPGREGLMTAPSDWTGTAWLAFRGRWGEMGAQGDFSGPFGPADKGGQWEHPYLWGLAQPLDTEVWYANRVRVEVLSASGASLELTDRQGGILASAEAMGPLAILHGEPPREGLITTIRIPSHTRSDLIATWPERQLQQVTIFRFQDVDFAETGLARLELGSNGVANLFLRCLSAEDVATSACLSSVSPAQTTSVEATWDAPDPVWVGAMLPAHEVGTGLLLAVLMSAVPTALYVGGLYWLDRYEKEPRLLVTAAFLWGTLPALVLALVAEVVLGLPADLLGTRALEAVQLGIIAPVLQEVLKGAAVLVVALRYRREFDEVLDGIVYGAVVGFGFAMMRNLINLVSAFSLHGFQGLGLGAYVEGLLFSLDHASYTAAFGAGLGAARLSRQRWRRWAAAASGFLLAVAAHTLRTVLSSRVAVLEPVMALNTCAGVAIVGLVAHWSMRRQRSALRSELREEVDAALYETLVAPGGRARAQWRALRSGGLTGLRRKRRLHHSCVELALKKMQLSLRPDEFDLVSEIERLRSEIHALSPQ